MSECRICLSARKNVRCIFESLDRSLNTTYADMITYVASVKITREDGITDQICLSCRKRLRDLYDFKLLILSSNTQLHQKNNSNFKRIHFNDIADVKLEITAVPTDDKYLLKEFEDIKVNLRNEDSICYKETTIKKLEPCVEVEIENQPMSVMDFLDTIKKDLEDDCDQDFDADQHGPESDSDEYLPHSAIQKKYGKKHKKKKKSNLPKPFKNGTTNTDKPASKRVRIKPTWIEDLRVVATYEPRPPREKKKYKSRSKEGMCPYCGKITKNLTSHLVLHSEARYKCDYEGCGKTFHHRGALLQHERSHTAARDYRCDQCVAAFYCMQSLNSHKACHDQTRRFVCETCSKSYKRSHQLSRHVRTHNSANKSFACEQCNMSFFSTYGLRHHMRVHTGERPYNCELCSQPYSYKHDFNRHCLKKHGVFLKRRSVSVMNAEVSSCVCMVVCVGLFFAIHAWIPRARALKRPSNMDAYMVDARTDLRNYVVGLEYEDAPPDAPPAPLPEFILDYANMIRNDIILLDNSVETRTRKRGNIKVKKHTNQATSNVPCDCERTHDPDYGSNIVNLSEALGVAVWYPPEVRNLTCDENKCAKPYRCQKIIYNLTVLKRTSSIDERNNAGQLYRNMTNELKFKWVPRAVPVVAACLCTSTYLAN